MNDYNVATLECERCGATLQTPLRAFDALPRCPECNGELLLDSLLPVKETVMAKPKPKDETQTAPATGAAEKTEAAVLPFVPKVKKAVTRPVLKLFEETPVYVKILSKIYTGKELKGTDKTADMKPAQIADVVDLATGEEKQLICGALVESSLVENYESDAYVKKCFMITKHAKKEGKRYFTYSISEIEDPTA